MWLHKIALNRIREKIQYYKSRKQANSSHRMYYYLKTINNKIEKAK